MEATARGSLLGMFALAPGSWRPKWRPRTAFTGEHIRTRTNTRIVVIPPRGRLCEHRRTPANTGEHRCGIVRNQQVVGSSPIISTTLIQPRRRYPGLFHGVMCLRLVFPH